MPAALGNLKLCPKCKENKAIDQFGRDSKRIDGLKPWCKSCRKLESAKDFQNNKEKRLKQHREWVSANPGKMGMYVKQWIERNPEKRKAIDDAYNAGRDPELHRKRVLTDYHKNPEKHLTRSRQWRQSNKKTVAAIAKAYRKANPELIATLKRNYKARKKGAKGTHTAEDIIHLYKKQKALCVYCRTSIKNGYEADHWVPLNLKGTNWPENLQLLCSLCNGSKSDKHPFDYEREIGFKRRDKKCRLTKNGKLSARLVSTPGK